MSTEKLIRISSFMPRKKGMTHEEFYRHWTQVHAPLVLDFMKRAGVVEYRQFHTPPETKALGDDFVKATGRPMLHFDGSSDAYVKDFKTFQKAFELPEYAEKVRPDELLLFDVENIQMTIGYDYVILENGEIVQEHARTF